MERKIGEIFEYNGEWYQCVKDDMYDYCKGCASFENQRCTTLYGNRDCWLKATCKKLEKVGQPYLCNYYVDKEALLMQPYRYYGKDTDVKCPNAIHAYIINRRDKIVAIEIKQNQEDMEEKELTYEELRHYYDTTVGLWAIDRSPQEVDLKWIVENAFQLDIDTKHSNSESIGKNLRPFSLEAAKSGKPVCTRGGRKARIICFDAKGTHPIIALVSDQDIEGEEIPFCYTNDGFYNNPNCESDHDLMILPEKKEGWVNVAKEPLGDDEVVLGYIFSSYEDAVRSGKANERYVATVRIEWEG